MSRQNVKLMVAEAEDAATQIYAYATMLMVKAVVFAVLYLASVIQKEQP